MGRADVYLGRRGHINRGRRLSQEGFCFCGAHLRPPGVTKSKAGELLLLLGRFLPLNCQRGLLLAPLAAFFIPAKWSRSLPNYFVELALPVPTIKAAFFQRTVTARRNLEVSFPVADRFTVMK